MRHVVIAVLVLVAGPASAAAESYCGMVHATPIPRADVVTLADELRPLLARVDDASASPSTRIAAVGAFLRATDAFLAVHIPDAFCQKPADEDIALLGRLLSRTLTTEVEPDDFSYQARAMCSNVVRSTYTGQTGGQLCRPDVLRAPMSAADATAVDAAAAEASRLRAVLVVTPADRGVILALAGVELNSGDPARALQTVAALPPADPDALHLVVRARMTTRDVASARLAAELEVRRAPESAQAHEDLAIVLDATLRAGASSYRTPTRRDLARDRDHNLAFLCLAAGAAPETATTLTLERLQALYWYRRAGHRAVVEPRRGPPPIPVEYLGPSAPRAFDIGRPPLETCATVLRRTR